MPKILRVNVRAKEIMAFAFSIIKLFIHFCRLQRYFISPNNSSAWEVMFRKLFYVSLIRFILWLYFYIQIMLCRRYLGFDIWKVYVSKSFCQDSHSFGKVYRRLKQKLFLKPKICKKNWCKTFVKRLSSSPSRRRRRHRLLPT